MIVQGVAKQTTQSKGLRISTQINLTGQWLVLFPAKQAFIFQRKSKILRSALNWQKSESKSVRKDAPSSSELPLKTLN